MNTNPHRNDWDPGPLFEVIGSLLREFIGALLTSWW